MCGTRASKLTRVLALTLVLLVACSRAHGTPSDQVLTPSLEPEQVPESPDAAPVMLVSSDRKFLATRLAHYRVTARVLSRERYFLGWTSALSPIDFALGWGRLADPALDELIDWTQGGRWYFFSWSRGCPLTTQEIQLQSANTHIVPATLNLRRALLHVSRNDLIKLEGSLVSITAATGDVTEPWRSSLSRSDHGQGACEILYVESLITHGLLYR